MNDQFKQVWGKNEIQSLYNKKNVCMCAVPFSLASYVFWPCTVGQTTARYFGLIKKPIVRRPIMCKLAHSLLNL